MALPEQLQDPIVYALPAFLVFMGLELLSFRFLDEDERTDYAGFDRTDSRNNILIGLGSLVVNGGARLGALVGYAALYSLTPLRLDSHRWYSWVAVLLLVDLVWYLYHRASHRVRLMWAGHQAHHNSLYFNFTTAVRQKWNPWFELLFWVPLPLLGVPPWMIFTAFSVNLVYQFFVHTERFGKFPAPVEFVMNTPSHHRVHHASDADYLDKNYAGILIIWDRMFGTFAAETHRPTYGLTTNIESTNPFWLQYHEYAAIVRDVRAARTWRERMGYLFAPPGWRPVAPVDAEPVLVTQ